VRTQEIQLIVNQDAGKVPAKMKLLTKLAKENGLRLKMCDGPDLDSTIRDALKNRKLKRIIIGGGDGSVSLVASLVRRKKPDIEIAILPLGTANYYARSLGVTRNLTQAFDVALGGYTEQRHLCSANKKDFLIGVNVGATSQMFSEVTDEDKKRYGKLAYFSGLAKVLFRSSAPDIEVRANGKKYFYTSTELVVLNQYMPDSIHMTPKVSGAEPYFEIITYGLGNNSLSPLFAVVIFALSLGRNQKYLKRIRATKAEIRSRKKQPVAIDGDNIERLPLKIELIKKPVTFVSAN